MDERDKALKIRRAIRRKIAPDILEMAERAALTQIGETPPEPENEASRLFKAALEDGGRRRVEILRHLERKFRHKLN